MYDIELKVLDILNKKCNISQRGIASAADISIGKVNSLIKSFTDEGYIRVEKISNKQSYILNETGLSLLEKNIKNNVVNKIIISSRAKKNVECAVILAAGESLEFEEPVGALKLGDKTVIERIIMLLRESGIKKIVIVAGYKGSYYKKLTQDSNIFVVENSDYKASGTMTSLAMAKEHIQEDFLLVEGDLAFEKKAITKVLEHNNRDCILITDESGSGDEVFVEIRNEFLFKMSKDKHQFNRIDGEMIGICKISLDIFKKMLEEFKEDSNPYLNYEYMLFDIARTYNIGYVKVKDLIWSEIDTKWHYKNLTNYIYPMIVKKESKGEI